jgi:hypothetical protein
MAFNPPHRLAGMAAEFTVQDREPFPPPRRPTFGPPEHTARVPTDWGIKMSSRIRNTLNASFAALVVGVAAITFAADNASAFSLDSNGFGHMGSGHAGALNRLGNVGHLSGRGHFGGTRNIGNISRGSGMTKLGRGFAAGKSGGLRGVKHIPHPPVGQSAKGFGKVAAKNGDRPVGNGMYEKHGTGTLANGDRPVGNGMYEKHGTGTLANGDRPVGNDMYEKHGTGTLANGDRPVGNGMYEKHGTGTLANGDRPVGNDMYEKHGTGTLANGDRPVGNGMYEKHGTGTLANDDRPVGNGMYEKHGTGTLANDDRPVGNDMYEKHGTGTLANDDRPVGNGMYEKHGTGTLANGDRPVGNGMYEKHGTGSHANDDHETENRVHDEGWRVDFVPPAEPDVSISYGSTPEVGLVRVDDLPQNQQRTKSSCHELQAKVQKLMNTLTRQLRVLATLRGAQNVDYSGTTTGTSTSFASPEAAQFAIDRIQSDIADTQQLLARYLADLARCMANGN